MARRVFFSFHFELDAWRAGVVRNSNLTKYDIAGYVDAANWEQVKKGGDEEIKRWINRQLDGTSVTVVLIGAETNQRKYVKYELEQSYNRGNGIVGVRIHLLKNQLGMISGMGSDDFGAIFWDGHARRHFRDLFDTYDWINNNGYDNFGRWVETAAYQAGK